METILKLLAVLSAGMFAGAAFYLTTVEHPARMSGGAAAALQEFRPSYRRAAPQQAALAIVCLLASAAVAAFTHDWIWLAGGCLVGALVPFTFMAIMATNRWLLDETHPLDADAAARLLADWGRWRAVRTVLSLIGFLVLLWACVARR